MPGKHDDSGELLTSLLKGVSRSFYLTLRVLPARVRRPIGLAYLLARTTDTIADTEVLPVVKRLEALSALRRRIGGQGGLKLDFHGFIQHQGSPAERELLQRAEAALDLLEEMEEGDQTEIREVLDVIGGGQELDLQRFGTRQGSSVTALETEADLDDYTWRVAGCVGRFWTRVCRRHLFPGIPFDEAEMVRDGIRFGKGLQLINILRDLSTDLRQGRCYLPRERLLEVGLVPEDLLAGQAEARLRPVVDRYLGMAEGHLAAGWEYTNRLPRGRGHRRVRLACAWPILIGKATLNRLRQSPLLDPTARVKISRGEVYRIMARSVFCLARPASWRRQF